MTQMGMTSNVVSVTACVLLANSAYVQASILVASMTVIIWKFYRYNT